MIGQASKRKGSLSSPTHSVTSPGKSSKRGRGGRRKRDTRASEVDTQEDVALENPLDDVQANEGDTNARDDDLLRREREMQIVPFILRPENSKEIDPKDENSLLMQQGEDILQKTRLFSCSVCPPIPLCRLIPYAKVRGLRDDISGLKVAFGNEGYVPEKGVFIVSMWTLDREEQLITDEIQQTWDPIWMEINQEFEEELASRPELESLVGHMFFVWEGNHRTVAWTEAIREKHLTVRTKHVRVLSTVIDPTAVSEIALLSCLQRMNL